MTRVSDQLTIDDLAGLFGRFEEDLRQSMFVRDVAAASSSALDPRKISQAYLRTATAGGGALWGAVYSADVPNARLLASVEPSAASLRFSAEVDRDLICDEPTFASGVLPTVMPPGLVADTEAPPHVWVLGPIRFGNECLGAAVLGFESEELMPHAAVLNDAYRQLASALHNAGLYEAQSEVARLSRILDDADVRMLASATPEDVCAIAEQGLEDALGTCAIDLQLPHESDARTHQARMDASVRGGRLDVTFRIMERPGSLRVTGGPERRHYTPAEVDFVQRLVSTMALAAESRMLQIERDQMMRARENWVADLSHDIRTPLATIRGYAELLATGEGVDEEEVQRQAGLIAKQATAIERLVKDLRNAFEAHFSTLPVAMTSADIAPLVEEALQAAVWHAGRGRSEIPFERPDHPVFALVDESHFSRVVANIATNAFVHNPPETTVRALLTCDAAAAHITIADDGLGMAPSLAERACKRGERGDSGAPGSGLGMAIVHELTQAIGGQVRVDSVQGRGTSVTVTVPLDPARREACKP